MKYDIIIAIDPDVDASGVAILKTESREMRVAKLTFAQVAEMLHRYADTDKQKTCVVIEAGWLNASNWHTTHYDTVRSAAKKGYDVGRNHETGRKMVEMCEFWGMPHVVQQRPLRKCWNGKDGKITQDEIMQFVPGLPKRMNQDERDAALLAWNEAGFPIRLRCLKLK